MARAAVGGTQAPHVLEIGCGTEILTRALLARGAQVTAIDLNPEMLDVARQKLSAAVEISDRFPAAHYDIIASTLALSEMSEEEQAYVLAAASRVLRSGGRLVNADEVRQTGRLARFGYACLRWRALPPSILNPRASTGWKMHARIYPTKALILKP